MKANSKKTRAMASESIPVKMALSLKDYGKTMCKTARDRQIGLTVQVIPESTSMDAKKDTVFTSGRKEINTKDSGIIIKSKGSAFMSGPMGVDTKGIGERI